MGIKDRVAGCRQIVEGMRQMRDIHAGHPQKSGTTPPETSQPVSPEEEPMDPKIQAMIDRQIAKGRIIR